MSQPLTDLDGRQHAVHSHKLHLHDTLLLLVEVVLDEVQHLIQLHTAPRTGQVGVGALNAGHLAVDRGQLVLLAVLGQHLIDGLQRRAGPQVCA